MVAKSSLLGVGIYSVAEAAFYARMHPRTMRRWVFGDKNTKPVLKAQFREEKLVSFVEFVEALAVRAIRQNHKIRLDRIRQAVRNAESKYGIKHLLARKHVAYVFDEDVFILPPGVDQKPYVQISGEHVGSQIMPVLELHLDDIGFDAEGLAEKYCVFRYDSAEVWMNPHIRFGEPLLPSGYSASTLWEASQQEGSIEAAAIAYGVSEEEVNLACRCYDHLIGPAAA